jgi:hypothetical protein
MMAESGAILTTMIFCDNTGIVRCCDILCTEIQKVSAGQGNGCLWSHRQGKASRTIHGGAALVWPLIQDYAFLSLTPITI